MSFFDLSIPYIEKYGAPSQDARSRRDCRLRTVARTMELGYTAVAYDRPFRGVLSDADRCQIAPFPPQSFLESISGCSPAAFSASVALHRDLLGVPHTSPFRQYTRITVSVDSVAAASALNAGNRLLRSYDLVATRPLNQLAFDQACNASEVDIISLDFSQKLPFRLKLAMVQAAIKRGVHFEISYSHIIAGSHSKRQILSDAKRLAEWTRGKSLIISGSTASLSEVRGPCDVANLSTVLLGLTMERAKAAISGNCRSLVANALRKKDCFFKEAIRIERILPEVKMDSQSDWFREWSDWDPISSGEHDLPSLDDMTKLFSAASKHSNHQNAVDFTSSINGMPPNASIFSSTCKFELDSADQHSNVDHASAENVAAMAAASVPNDTNEESRPCSEENCREIDVFESAYQTSMSISDDLSLKSSGPADGYGAGMIRASNICDGDVEVAGQVDAMNGKNFLECSFVGSRDQISMVDSGTIIALEEHHSEKMELALLLETSISDDAQIKLKQENQLNSASTAASGIVILSDRSAKMEMQLKENDFGIRNNLKEFLTETSGKKKRVSAVEIQKADEFSEDLSTALKYDQCFSSENDSPLNEMEGQIIQRPAKAVGVTDRQIHKSGKERLRRISHHRGYLLTARSLCKPLIFKKVSRLRRMRKFFVRLDL